MGLVLPGILVLVPVNPVGVPVPLVVAEDILPAHHTSLVVLLVITGTAVDVWQEVMKDQAGRTALPDPNHGANLLLQVVRAAGMIMALAPAKLPHPAQALQGVLMFQLQVVAVVGISILPPVPAVNLQQAHLQEVPHPVQVPVPQALIG